MPTHRSRMVPAALLAVGSVSLSLMSGAGVGNASPSSPDEVAVPEYSASKTEQASPKIKRELDAHLDQIKNRVAATDGGKIISVKRLDYKFKDKKTNRAVAPQDIPEGCALQVVMTFEQNTDKRSVVHNNSLTSCNQPTVEMSHHSDITKFLGIVPVTVAFGSNFSDFMDRSLTSHIQYECRTANTAKFRSTTFSTVVTPDEAGEVKHTDEESYPCGGL